ncbi:MAG: hypothetical protein B7Z08_12075 [Sphingomonadales bacterium 32-68-7]|nr:MAG: hypothetical protein B7Z33_04165 [Sphingomonadales bacterium 12-68-11]OYX07590.1 MAG: hypothetical protein B7Z08_12075 [Sphingomonadales bacterium 32-68-7]
MDNAPTRAGWTATARPRDLSALLWLAVILGTAMPVAAAAIYPTYMHQMEQPWLEWTRLLELPFVACEMAVIHFALRRGLQDREIWQRLPADVKIAGGLLLIGLTASSAVASKNFGASLAISLFTLVHIRFALAVYHLVRSEQGRGVDLFVPALAAGMPVLAGLTAWKFAFPPPEASVFGGSIEWGSALPGFISVRHFGSWTGALAAGLIVALIYTPDGHRQRWTGLLYVCAVVMTVWSGTRAAVLAVAVVGLVFLVALRRLPSPAAALNVIGLTALGLVGALCLPAPSPDFLLYQASDMGSANSVSGGRLELWGATFAKWLEAPVFGWGSGSTFWEVHIGWAHTQPHNVILQFLVSWGLVGAAGGLWLLGRAIRAVHRRGVAEPALRPLTAVLYALLFMSLLEGMLHYPRFIMVIMVGFAVILAHRDIHTRTG